MFALLSLLLLIASLTLMTGLLILRRLSQFLTSLSGTPVLPCESAPPTANHTPNSQMPEPDLFHQSQDLDEILKSRQIDEGIENLMTYTVQNMKPSAR